MYNEYISQLQEIKLFENMMIDEIKKVLGCLSSYIRQYKKGNYIYMEGDCFDNIGIVLQGTILVNREYESGSININILHKNNTFGEDIVYLNSNYAPYSLIANSDVKVLYIKGKKLIEPESIKCKYRSQINLNMLKCLAKYSVYANKRIKYMNIISLKKRISMFLLDCQEEYKSNKFSIEMNREVMAYYLNSTRTSVSRILSELKNQDIIQYNKSTFVIKNRDALFQEINK